LLWKEGNTIRNFLAQRIVPYCYRSKLLMPILFGIGILAVSYGMLAENNMVFIAGLLCGISGYLLIRRRLKQN